MLSYGGSDDSIQTNQSDDPSQIHLSKELPAACPENDES